MKAIADVVTEALTETLETMAFCSVDSVTDDMEIPPRLVHVKINYKGPKEGSLQILGGWELGQQIAECIGCVEAMEDRFVIDAWKEICNVLSGLVIPAIADSQADIYDITVPVATIKEQSPTWNEFIGLPDAQVVCVEGCAVATHLNISTCYQEEEIVNP